MNTRQSSIDITSISHDAAAPRLSRLLKNPLTALESL
jgi:hypothetical protein